jgi:squalene-hopene/tetraprenyl-beta-curcumene cyclase
MDRRYSTRLSNVTDRLFQWIPGLRGQGRRSVPVFDGTPADLSLHDPRFAPPPLLDALGRAQQSLLRAFNFEDGYWCGELRCDTTVVSDYVMLLHYLGRGDSPKIAKLCRHILSEQLEDGGWPLHPGGPADLSATVKAYWALKFAGRSPDEPALRKAARRITELGGIHRVNTYTKLYMALFGQYDWRGVPAIPPELLLFPKWFYFNIYEMSSWTRAIVIPLSIVWAKKATLPCPAHARLDELFPDSRRWLPLRDTIPTRGLLSWTNFFLLWDEFLNIFEGRGPSVLRAWTLRKAEDWILERLQDSDGLGAIFPGIVNTILAMKALGYSDFDPRLRRQLSELEKLELEDGEALRLQPCFPPVWDTAIAAYALGESGLPADHPALVRAVEWMLAQEIKREGDWKVKNPRGRIGGWAFEFNNAFYPDVDDTAMVLMALPQAKLPEASAKKRREIGGRALSWVLSMQCGNGGWAAFDKDCDKHILTKIPFADHNAMIDPPTADITARVLEMLGRQGWKASDRLVRPAIEMIRDEQETDGSWYGRWGVNYIYGTWQVLRGLRSIGADMSQAWIQRGAEWLESVQQEDGGWGETCETYADPAKKGCGPSTPSQTAWALMGLLAVRGPGASSVERGFDYLLRTQRPDGGWDEPIYTGTGFPKVFYLEYTLYRLSFPIMALGTYLRARQGVFAKQGV